MSPVILIVDDEPGIRAVLHRTLKAHGFEAVEAETGREALQAVSSRPFDGMILDFGLPDVTGEDVFKAVRAHPQTQALPILVLTGASIDDLPARCLNGGADSFLTKPFDLDRVVAQMRALLRRSAAYGDDRLVIQRGALVLRVDERQVLVNGQLTDHLAPKEFEILKLLTLRSPSVIDKATLASEVWGVPLEQLPQRTLDVHIRRIRRKLGPLATTCLHNVPAIGYQWAEPSAVR